VITEQVRILLDTNVWRRFVDEDAIAPLRSIVRERRARVLVAPAVVYEMLRTGDAQLRRRLVRAVTLGSWERLMTEAYEEAREVVEVIRRRRPEWLRSEPDLASFYRLQADWKGNYGFWRRARRDPGSEAKLVLALERDLFLHARAESRELRASFAHVPFEHVKLTGWTTRPLYGGIPGWEGGPVDAWRIDACHKLWRDVAARQEQGYVDWIEPFVDLSSIGRDRRSWDRLWLYEATAEEVPRAWIRWAVRLLQATRKVSRGTPGDNQISTHLVEADAFLTSDKAFRDIVAKLQDEAPARVASGHLLPATADPIASVEVLVGGGSR
jgi:hypothetical protein